MEWWRNLDPKKRRLVLVGGAGLVAVVVLLSRRRGAAPAADAAAQPVIQGSPPIAGVLPGAYLPNAELSGQDPSRFADVEDRLTELERGISGVAEDLRDLPALIVPPAPTGSPSASDLAQAIGDVLTPIVDRITAPSLQPPQPVGPPAPPAPGAGCPPSGTQVWRGATEPNMATLRARHPGCSLKVIDTRVRGARDRFRVDIA